MSLPPDKIVIRIVKGYRCDSTYLEGYLDMIEAANVISSTTVVEKPLGIVGDEFIVVSFCIAIMVILCVSIFTGHLSEGIGTVFLPLPFIPLAFNKHNPISVISRTATKVNSFTCEYFATKEQKQA